MYTGIVQGKGRVVKIVEKENFRQHVVDIPSELLSNLTLGASVAHNGCCLTVTEIQGNLISFDLSDETLKLTNLGELKVGDSVNIERSAKLGDEVGGHALSGHIIGMAIIDEIIETENNKAIWFSLPEGLEKYIFHKGFIGVDGISLTVGEIKRNRFSVHLIPETLQRTTLEKKQLKDRVNIEIDTQTQVMVNTIERVLEGYLSKIKG